MKWLTINFGTSLVLASLYLLNNNAGALEFRRHPDTDTQTVNGILASGPIVRGDTERLRDYLRRLTAKPTTKIHLSSPGGDLQEGMALGRLFKSMRIRTVVEGGEICASACAVAFLGGHDIAGKRWMASTTTSQLGFHQFRCVNGTTCNEGFAQFRASELITYAEDEMGAPRQIIRAILETPPDKLTWFGVDELLSLGVMVWDISRNCYLPCPKCVQRIQECKR